MSMCLVTSVRKSSRWYCHTVSHVLKRPKPHIYIYSLLSLHILCPCDTRYWISTSWPRRLCGIQFTYGCRGGENSYKNCRPLNTLFLVHLSQVRHNKRKATKDGADNAGDIEKSVILINAPRSTVMSYSAGKRKCYFNFPRHLNSC